jgi:hypothetical protein
MTLTLTPEQERRLTAYARQKQKPIPAALDDLLPDVPTESPEGEDAAPVGLQEQFSSEAELDRWLDEVAEAGRGKGYLPDSAFDRETLYDERL